MGGTTRPGASDGAPGAGRAGPGDAGAGGIAAVRADAAAGPGGGTPGGADAARPPRSPLSPAALLVSLVLLVASLAVGLVGLARVGVDATVPIHWDASGQANGWGPAWLSLLVTPAIQAGLLALLALIPRYEPRRLNLSRSGRAYSVIVVGVMALMAVVQVAVVAATLGGTFDMPVLVMGGVGVLFIAIGLVMPGFQPNYLAGIRTPWTLTSDLSWRKTHVVGGRLFVVVGAGMIVAMPFVSMFALVMGMLVGLTVMLVALFAYSYRVWKSDPDKRAA